MKADVFRKALPTLTILLLIAPSVLAQSSFQEAATCWATKVLSSLTTAPSTRVRVCMLPCRNLGGLDTAALQQLGQLLQGELTRQGGEGLSLSTTLSTYDLDGNPVETGMPEPADLWVEPAAAYNARELVISYRVYGKSLTLGGFGLCATRLSPTELMLFSIPAPVIAAGALEKAFASQPLPFRASDFDAAPGDDGVTRLAFLAADSWSLFELRESTLLLLQRVELPPPAATCRDRRGSIWLGPVGGTQYVLLQRCGDPAVQAFAAAEQGWQPSAAPFELVPLSGAPTSPACGTKWQTGRNFSMLMRQQEGGAASSVAQQPPLYAATILRGDSPRVARVHGDSSLTITELDGSHPTRLPQRCGDAVAGLKLGDDLIVVASLPVPGADGDGLRGVRVSDGVVVLETPLPGLAVEALRAIDNRLFVLARNAEGTNFLHVYDLKKP